jgi:hypothetical protein
MANMALGQIGDRVREMEARERVQKEAKEKAGETPTTIQSVPDYLTAKGFAVS